MLIFFLVIFSCIILINLSFSREGFGRGLSVMFWITFFGVGICFLFRVANSLVDRF